MKKYIKYGLSCIAATALTTSCDVMDTKPKASFSEETVWSTEETADAFAIGVYGSALSGLTGSNASMQARTPDGVRCDQVESNIDNIATELGLNLNTDMGFNRFATLRSCNVLIKKASESSLPERKKQELVAEGYFLRGCIFFDQARKIGRFVPVTEVLETTDLENFKRPITQTMAESYKYVIEDLTVGAYGMVETSLSGRANRYAAHLIRSRAALQAYAYTGDEAYLDTCIVSANAVIGSGKYPLTDEYGDLFNDKSPTNKEIILARYYLAEDNSVSSFSELIHAMPNITDDDLKKSMVDLMLKNINGQTFNGWAVYWPTQDLIDQYLAVDEITGKALPWDQTTQFINNVNVLDPASITTAGAVDQYQRTSGDVRRIPSDQDLKRGHQGYPQFKKYLAIKSGNNADLSDIMYKNRDRRLDQTIAHDKSTLLGETVTTNLGGNLSQGVRDKEDGGWYTTTTGYYWKKGVYNVPTSYYSVKTNYHYTIARSGEAYLNLAEAQLLKNNITACVSALNETRMKHGGLPGSTASTKAEAWADYMRERRVEMAYENGDIYYSYLRWGKYGGESNYNNAPGEIIVDLNRPVYKIQISRDRKKVVIGQLTVLDSWNRNFTKRRYLFPIPKGELDNRSIYGINDGPNNEGW